MSEPRVLMTTTAYPPSTGGVQGYLADLRAGFRRYRADVVTLWLRNRTDWLLGSTLRLGEPPPAEVAAGVRALGWDARTRLRMAPWALGYYGLVPIAARRLGELMVPGLDRLVRPEYRLIHNHRIGREFLAEASLRVARRRGLPFALTPYHHPRWKGYRYRAWISIYREADAVFTLTAAEQEELVRLGVKAERLHVIGGAADQPLPADGARFRARLGTGDGPLVLFLGQLYDYKGVADLFEAAEAVRRRGVELELVYAGPPTPFSDRFFAGRARPWLHVLGRIDDQSKWDALEAATVLAVPSRQESFGRVYLEAWSKSKPVIGARIPSVAEVVTDGETGLLVEPGSVAGLAAALERLLADTALGEQLGGNGLREIAKRFNWPEVVRRVEAVYDELIAAAARA
jgi:glycosyltransferase involved in cell wall biosynthesis